MFFALRPNFRVFIGKVSEDSFCRSESSLRLGLSFRACPIAEPPQFELVSQTPRSRSKSQPHAAPPLRFLTLQRVLTRSSSMGPGLPHPATSVFRCSQPRDAFIRPSLTGPISCQIRSWVRSSELYSFREAVHCFQHHYPLGVAIAFRVLLRSKVRFPFRRFRPETGT